MNNYEFIKEIIKVIKCDTAAGFVIYAFDSGSYVGAITRAK